MQSLNGTKLPNLFGRAVKQKQTKYILCLFVFGCRQVHGIGCHGPACGQRNNDDDAVVSLIRFKITMYIFKISKHYFIRNCLRERLDFSESVVKQ